MELEQIAYIAEIFAASLVVVSLVYVGVQVQQNTRALKLSTAHNTSESFTDNYLALVADGDVASIFQRGLQDIESLDAVEKVRFYAFFHKWFRTYENAYYQFRNDALESEAFEGLSQQMIMLNTMPGVQDYWAARKNFYNQSFQEYVDNEVITNQSETFQLVGT